MEEMIRKMTAEERHEMAVKIAEELMNDEEFVAAFSKLCMIWK